MQGIIALGNPGFATGDDVYEVISQLQNSRSNYHYLGVSNEEVAQLVNRMTPIQKEAFNTEIFVVQRTNGTVVQYALLKGEGPFGAGKQQVTMADLVDLSAGQSLTLDEAMSDSSNNSVKNRVIKAYVDRVKENALVIDLIPPRCDVAAGSRNDLKILSDKIKNNERFNLFVRIMHDDSQVYELYPAICNGRGDGSYIEFFTYNGSNGSSLRYAEKLNANRYQISVSSGSMMASDYFSLTTANIIKPSIPADNSWNDYVLSIGGLRKELKQLNSISAVFDIGREPGRQSVDLSAAEAQGFAAILENNPKIIFMKTDVYTYPTRFSGNRDENGGFSYTIDTISDLKQAQHSNYQYLEEEYIRLFIRKTVTTDENGQVTGTTYEASKQKTGSTAFMTSPYTIRHYQQNTDSLFSTDLRRYITLLQKNTNYSGQTSHGIVPLLIEHQTDPENAEKFQLCHGQIEAQDYNPNTNTGKIIIRWSLVMESGWQNYKAQEYTAEAELSFDQVSNLTINYKDVELHEQNTDTHTNSNEFSIGKQAYNSAYTTLEQYPNGNKLVLKYHDIFPENQKMLADLYVNSLHLQRYDSDGTLGKKEAWISANISDDGQTIFAFNGLRTNEDGSANGITANLEAGNIRCEDVQMGNQLTLLNRKEEEEPYVYSSYALNMQLVRNGEKKENNAYPAKLMIQDWNSANSYGAVDMGDLAVNGTATVNGQEVVTADTLKGLAHKDQADWETDITNKPEFIHKIKAGREVINPGPDNSVYFRENDVIIPAKCEAEVKTKGTGNVVIYGYYDETANSTEIRVKCTEHLLKQLISCASWLNSHYQATNSEDVEETGSAYIFFTAASIIGLKKDGYWSCKKIQNSKALRIENYDIVTALDAPDYNTPVNIWLNTDVLPEDVAPVYNQDKLEFLHSEEAGFKHIPAGGTAGQILYNAEDGTGMWYDLPPVVERVFADTREMDLPENKLIFKPNDAIKPAIVRPAVKTKGTGNIAVYTHKNEDTGEIELRLKAKEMLVVNLIPKVLYFSCTKVDNSDVTTTISKGCLISVQTQSAIIKNGYFKFESVSDAKSLTIDSVTQTAVAPNYNDPINFHLNTDVLPADVDPVFELEGMQFKHTDTTGFKHIPAGGTVGQVLTNTEDGTAEWQDIPESTALPTGVEGKFLKATGDESYEWADIPMPDLNGKVDKVEGKGLSTEDISIVITPTLASSYPDGTIVIKTA